MTKTFLPVKNTASTYLMLLLLEMSNGAANFAHLILLLFNYMKDTGMQMN